MQFDCTLGAGEQVSKKVLSFMSNGVWAIPKKNNGPQGSRKEEALGGHYFGNTQPLGVTLHLIFNAFCKLNVTI
jgi:hypothetical protein